MYKRFFAIGLAICFAVTGGFLGWQKIQLNMRDAEYEEPDLIAEEIAADVLSQEPVHAEEPVLSDDVPVLEEPALSEDVPVLEEQPSADELPEGEEITVSEETVISQEAPSEEVQTVAAEKVPRKVSTVLAPDFVEVDTSYFQDALFVGDSRMVGIKEYGGLSEPTYFAGTGLSTFRLYKEELEVAGMGTVNFERVLSSRQFGKVYIMLGINEAGSKLSEYRDKYDGIVADIKEKQPDALIFLCSNLHVTKEKSERDSTYSNSHIDDINKVVESLAIKYGAYYLDVNPLFDDGEGNLSTDYAADYAHMYGRCYLTWIDWLCTKGIVPQKEIIEQAY